MSERTRVVNGSWRIIALAAGVSALLMVTLLHRGGVTEPVAPGVAPDDAAAVKPTAPELAHVSVHGRRLVVEATGEADVTAVQTPGQLSHPYFVRPERLSDGAQELMLAAVAVTPSMWILDSPHRRRPGTDRMGRMIPKRRQAGRHGR